MSVQITSQSDLLISFQILRICVKKRQFTKLYSLDFEKSESNNTCLKISKLIIYQYVFQAQT